MRRLAICVLLSVFILAVNPCSAEIPKLINYQGMLADDSGAPLTDTVSITFKIYIDSLSAADIDKRWEETHSDVQVINGLFNVTLGTASSLDLNFSENYWLDITVEGEHLPDRIRFTSVGYAFRAAIADSATASGSGGGGGWVDDGEVVRLDSSGDSVGIGTSDPAAKLDVVGDVNINSVYKIAGEAVLSTPDSTTILVGVGAGRNNTGTMGTLVGHLAGTNNQGSGNTFLGQKAGYTNSTGFFNTFLGYEAGSSNTEGARNTFLGYRAGNANTEGVNNTFLGYYAGYQHLTSDPYDDDNVFVGHFSGFSDKSGWGNTFLGSYAGYSNQSNDQNTFVGSRAGYSMKGDRNTFIGSYAGESSTTGYGNTYVGGFTGWHNENGAYNTYLGYCAGYNGSGAYGGSANTYVGYFAGQGSQEGDSNIFIGYMAGSNQTSSGKLIIANGPDTINIILYGDFNTGKIGIGTADPTEKLDVNGRARIRTMDFASGGEISILADDNGVLYRAAPSSIKYKQNIRELNIEPDQVLKLQPVRFEWMKNGQNDFGLIAEEVEKVAPDLVGYNSDGTPERVKYDKLAVYLLGVIKAQQERISSLEKEVAGLKR